MTAMASNSKDFVITALGIPALAVAVSLIGASLFGWGIIVLNWLGVIN